MPLMLLQPSPPRINQQAPPCGLNSIRPLDLFPPRGKKRNPRGVCLRGGRPILGVSVSLPATWLPSAAPREEKEVWSVQTWPRGPVRVLCGWTWVGTSGSLAFGSWGQSGAHPAGAFVLSAPPERQGRVDIMGRATQRYSFSPSTAWGSHLTGWVPWTLK